ncbi:MAG: hypothetical protein U0J65_01020 [Christensenellales bacterium]|nr:hypothetical protein [Christensenellales bacterium]
MRIFILPAAFLLACFLYLPFPRAQELLFAALRRLYALLLRAFTPHNGKPAENAALAAFLLTLGGVLMLLSALHPLVAMALAAPAFTGLSILPGCTKARDKLNSGEYARDIPAYEALVRDTCRSLAPAFVQGVVAPMLLFALGVPLAMGASLAMGYTALRALEAQHSAAARIVSAIQHSSDRILRALMVLCSGAAGRNPLRTEGRSAQERLMSILGIDESPTHAPMAGDIQQGIFLCILAALLLCFTLCAVLAFIPSLA